MPSLVTQPRPKGDILIEFTWGHSHGVATDQSGGLRFGLCFVQNPLSLLKEVMRMKPSCVHGWLFAVLVSSTVSAFAAESLPWEKDYATALKS